MRPEGERELLADWFSRVRYVPELDWGETPADYVDDDDPDTDGVVAAVRPPIDGDNDGRVYDGTPRERPAPPKIAKGALEQVRRRATKRRTTGQDRPSVANGRYAEQIDRAQQVADRLANDFPSVGRLTVGLTSETPRGRAGHDLHAVARPALGRIDVAPRAFTADRSSMADPSIDGLIRHEFGHVALDDLEGAVGDLSYLLVAGLGVPEDKIREWDDPAIFERLRTQLGSSYAAASPEEALAEAFVVGSRDATTDSLLAHVVMAALGRDVPFTGRGYDEMGAERSRPSGQVIDAMAVEGSTVVAGATPEGIRGRDVLMKLFDKGRGVFWKEAVTSLSEKLDEEAVSTFADGVVAALRANGRRAETRLRTGEARYTDDLPTDEYRPYIDFGATDLGPDAWSPGKATLISSPFTFDGAPPMRLNPRDDNPLEGLYNSGLVVGITADPLTHTGRNADEFTPWLWWGGSGVLRAVLVANSLRQADGTWDLPADMTEFGGPVGGESLVERQGLARAAAAMMRGAWASSVDNVASYFLREASLDLSGVPKRRLRDLVRRKASSMSEDTLKRFDAQVRQLSFMRPLAQSMVAAGYAATQERLAELGVSEVTVYRGLAETPGMRLPEDRGKVATAPMTSWTADWGIAQWFADYRAQQEFPTPPAVVLVRTVPAEQILSWAQTAVGSETEAELVLLGGTSDDTLLFEEWRADDETMATQVPVVAALTDEDGIPIVDDDWVLWMWRQRQGATWLARFGDTVLVRVFIDSLVVDGPEPDRTELQRQLDEFVASGWPVDASTFPAGAAASGIDPEWMAVRLLAAGADAVVGPRVVMR